ncbi:Wzz/FepE/Etk N-terminal domain-containing protein [Carboxylicivirga sp. M1479]|uniref:Wzz/FepE/Etk N-terminal domain-containing protein n=1 Tax=Carboxylicivirga sp. M1479 TaxID=2594476 RepID=UPI0011778972|nr:Wzz/FepE/Etk N-terminal domain-containing protein [Carboxylicivirga sp. M1479]TRX71990.1 lipopolysaccharide biosynthesis protein [Carboxylicivirga sp. M1479]
MNTENTNDNLQIIKDDEIDLIALVKTIWNGRKTIYYSIGVAVIIGLIIAFTSPVKYQAYSTLIPSEEKKGGMGNLGALAGMAGINLGSMMGGTSGIPAEVYPQVVNSYPFKKEMVHQKFHFEDYTEPISLYEYALADTIESLGSKVAKYTIRLPWTIKDALSGGNEDLKTELPDYGVLQLSEEELRAMAAVEQVIVIEVDKKTGLINVSAEVGEPVLVAQFVQKAVELLQNYVIRYKTKQAREHLEFIQKQYDQKKEIYEQSQGRLYAYKDKHRNMVSERVNLEFQRLSDDYDMSSTVFKGLAQQLEQAKIAVNEQTPAFTILEPAKVPIDKSGPKKKIILVVSVFLGGFVGLGVVFGKLVWSSVKNNF